MTERELTDAVVLLCRMLRLLVYHTHDSRLSQPGFPDLVICGARGILFRELKVGKNKLSEHQAIWLNKLNDAGADAGVWFADDWTNGSIERELRMIR